MKRLLRILPLTVIITLIPLLSGTAFAATASLYLAPSASSVLNGSTVTVYIHENSGSEPVNAAQANFSYPANLLQFVSINNASAFSIVAQNSGGNGSVAIARGAMPSVSGDQVVASVTFKALAGSGTASLAVTSGSAVVSANTNQNILTSSAGTSVTLTSPAPTPTPSPTPKPGPTPSPSPTPAAPKDTTPPTITNVTATNVTTSSATITWTTSEAATSEVDYGLNTNYGLASTDGKAVTSHTITLNSALIISGTVYHFHVKSTDGAGNTATSADYSFATKGATLVVTILDQKTGKPVAHAIVSYNGQSATTNQSGQATLMNLPSTKVTLQVTINGKTLTEATEVGSSTDKLQNASFKVAVPPAAINWYLIAPILIIVIAGISMFVYVRGRGGNYNQSNHFPPPPTSPMPPTPHSPVMPSAPQGPFTPPTPHSPVMPYGPPSPIVNPTPSVIISPTEPIHRDDLTQ